MFIFKVTTCILSNMHCSKKQTKKEPFTIFNLNFGYSFFDTLKYGNVKTFYSSVTCYTTLNLTSPPQWFSFSLGGQALIDVGVAANGSSRLPLPVLDFGVSSGQDAS